SHSESFTLRRSHGHFLLSCRTDHSVIDAHVDARPADRVRETLISGRLRRCYGVVKPAPGGSNNPWSTARAGLMGAAPHSVLGAGVYSLKLCDVIQRNVYACARTEELTQLPCCIA